MTEECEYGGDPCTVCAADCTEQDGIVPTCGDGRVSGPEACDDGNLIEELCTIDMTKTIKVWSLSGIENWR